MPFRRFRGALIPETLLRYRGISRGAGQLYGALARYAGQDGYCYPSQERLARDFRVSIRTIQRWVSELVRENFIEAIRQGLGFRSNQYIFLWHAALEGGQLSLGVEDSMPEYLVENERESEWRPDENVVSLPISEEGQKCKVTSSSPAAGVENSETSFETKPEEPAQEQFDFKPIGLPTKQPARETRQGWTPIKQAVGSLPAWLFASPRGDPSGGRQ